MRSLRVLVCVAMLAMVGAACGGSSGQKVTIEATPAAMRKSAEATLGKGTAKVEMSMDLTIKGQAVTMRGTGAFDQVNKRGQLDFDLKDFAKLSGPSLPPSVASAFDQPMTVILDGTVEYIRFPLLSQSPVSGGKEWLKIDLAAANSSLGDLLGSGSGGTFGSDPTSFLQFLEGTGKIAKVGDEDVRDVATTHFSGSYTLKDALDSLPADRRDKVEKAFTGLGLSDAARDQEIPFDAWVDNDGLIRRLRITVDPSTFTTQTSTPVGKVTITMELFDFGAPVDITIPSDDDVRDVSNLVSSGSSQVSSSASTIGN